VRQHPDLSAAEADGEVLMMHVESGHYFGLNEVASFVWQQLETPLSVADLCVRVQSEFDVDEERCMADLLDHLRSMIADGLTVTKPAGDDETATPA
jgi:hypothetical protein